ncbi:PBSX family phage terminase large subunit [soil metagenome]
MAFKKIEIIEEDNSILASANIQVLTGRDDITAKFSATRVLSANYKSRKPVVLNEGGARSSKSYSIAQLMIYRFFTERNKKFLICRKYMKSLKISVFRTFIELLAKHHLTKYVKINKTLLEFTFGNNYLLMTSIDDPTKLQSTEFNYIWMEEAEEFNLLDYITLKTRLSAKQDDDKKNQIFLSYNPKKRNSFVNKVVKLEKEIDVIKSSYKDNKHLQDEYNELLESLKLSSPEYYKVFALGEYAAEDELIYKHIKMVQEFPITEADERIFGLDFGFSNPAALLEILIKDNSYFVTELLYARGLTNSDIISRMKQMDIEPHERIYCDSSEPDRRLELRRAGFNVHLSNKNIIQGIDCVKSSIIYSLYSNENFNNELDNYAYKRDSQGNLFEFPEKHNDHLMDALRYAIFTHSKRKTPNVRFFTQYN